MATLWIAELQSIGRTTEGASIPVARLPALKHQKVTFSTATQSTAFDGRTRYVRLYADAACCLLFGDDPTATTDHWPIAADAECYIGVEPGHKVSVVSR